MPTPLPYIPAYGKIKAFFTKAASAKVPDSFTHAYLANTLGLKSTGDRPLIPLLRQLGLIDGSGKPTSDYATLKNPSLARKTIAAGTRRAFAPLFDANENAHTLNNSELQGLVAQIAGTDDEVTKRTVGTFKTLVDLGDFSAIQATSEQASPAAAPMSPPPPPIHDSERMEYQETKRSMKPEFHYNIQVHLPSNATEETYLNIFNALRKSFS